MPDTPPTPSPDTLKANLEHAALAALTANPTDPNAIWNGLLGLADAMDAIAKAGREARKARRNTPEALQKRAEAAQRGWEARRAREAAERAAYEAEMTRDDELAARVGTGPWCDAMNHNSLGREVFCILEPDHDDDCEDVEGATWPNPSNW